MRGVVLQTQWDDDHLWTVPSTYQRIRWTVLPTVFLVIGGLAAAVTIVLFLVMREPAVLFGLAFGALFGAIGGGVRLLGKRVLKSLTFAFSRTRGYHDGDRWHAWETVRRVSVARDLTHRVVVALADGGMNRHLTGQLGVSGETNELARLMPYFVPPAVLDPTLQQPPPPQPG